MSKIDKFGMATFAGIFNKDFSKILLIKRNKKKREKYGFDWAIVGGKIEFGEHSSDAILREIKEETGIDFLKKDISLLYVKEVPNWFNIAHVVFFLYGAVVDEKIPIVLNDEAEEYAWFDVYNLPESRSDDNIIEMRTLAKKQFNSEK